MSPIDYDALRSGGGGEPPNGHHKAILIRAKLVETQSGDRLVTEWQVNGLTPYYWTTWFGFEMTRLAFTQEFLDAIGVDRSQIHDDVEFQDALDAVTNRTFMVRTDAWSGGINTYPEPNGSEPAQTQLGDVPIDTGGLPEVSQQPVAAAAVGPDDDIPF